LGTGAHSYFFNCRFSFKKDVKEYIKNLNYDESKLKKVDMFDLDRYNLFDEYIQIMPNERLGEYVMLNFRLSAGIDTNKFAKLFYKDFDVIYYEKIKRFIDSGHIVKTPTGYAFSREGMFVSNYILSRIVDFELEKNK
jgi:oxygen-independent coproporphyrinogen-3 oxidase